MVELLLSYLPLLVLYLELVGRFGGKFDLLEIFQSRVLVADKNVDYVLVDLLCFRVCLPLVQLPQDEIALLVTQVVTPIFSTAELCMWRGGRGGGTGKGSSQSRSTYLSCKSVTFHSIQQQMCRVYSITVCKVIKEGEGWS